MVVGSPQGRRRTHRLQEWRGAVRQYAALAGLIACAAAPAAACELPDAKRIQGTKHSIAYRTLPARVAVGETFVVEIAVCPPASSLAANAHMPEHRHGMNYRPSVTPQGAGRFRSEGWVFHMPGRWEFFFDVGGERLADSLRLE